MTYLFDQLDELVVESHHVLLLSGFARRVGLVARGAFGRLAPGSVGLAAVISRFRHIAAGKREMTLSDQVSCEDTCSQDHLLLK